MASPMSASLNGTTRLSAGAAPHARCTRKNWRIGKSVSFGRHAHEHGAHDCDELTVSLARNTKADGSEHHLTLSKWRATLSRGHNKHMACGVGANKNVSQHAPDMWRPRRWTSPRQCGFAGDPLVSRNPPRTACERKKTAGASRSWRALTTADGVVVVSPG
jgi:hypothetical protein